MSNPRHSAHIAELPRGSEDDDLSPLRVAEPVRNPVGDHSVAELALAELGRLRAVKRWLHRRRGDAVRLGDLRFARQDDAVATAIVTSQSTTVRHGFGIRPCARSRTLMSRSTLCALAQSFCSVATGRKASGGSQLGRRPRPSVPPEGVGSLACAHHSPSRASAGVDRPTRGPISRRLVPTRSADRGSAPR